MTANGVKVGTIRMLMWLRTHCLPEHLKPTIPLFRVVPNLYCRGGDVAKDNGFGCYVPEGEVEPMGAENYDLKHSVPGRCGRC